jgi:HK97 family phage major capsid protein
VATYGAYPEASVELRTRPEGNGQGAPPVLVRRNTAGGLRVEDRVADATPTLESRVSDAIRSVRRGEVRSLTTTSAEPIAPTELSTFLWDRLRPLSIALASGLRIIPTDRESITWPRLTADVDPTWTAETDQIPSGDPGFGDLTATPRKLAHRVEMSNEVVDDSDPSAVDVVNAHLATVLSLKLDTAIFEANPAVTPNSIRGLRWTAGVQTIDMGADGAALGDYDVFIEAIGMLRAANVPGPYAIASHPSVLTELELLKEEAAGSNVQLGAPAGLPPFYVSSALSTTEPKGINADTRSAYVYSPAQVVLVRRKDAEIDWDRSRLYDRDMSEMRAKLRADLLVPNPEAVVRIVGIRTGA